MPTVYRWRGYRFYFFAYEGQPREPVHIHVSKDGAEAKFWLRPFVSVARNRGFDSRSLRLIADQVVANRDRIEAHWYAFFDG